MIEIIRRLIFSIRIAALSFCLSSDQVMTVLESLRKAKFNEEK